MRQKDLQTVTETWVRMGWTLDSIIHYKNYKITYIEPLLAPKIIQKLPEVSITGNHIHVLVLVGKLDKGSFQKRFSGFCPLNGKSV